jgi:hypothetical protein
MARIDPWGTVFPCLEQHVRIGSVREQDFPSIWNSIAFTRESQRIAADEQCSCWYNNTALISHYGRWLALANATGLWQAFRRQFTAPESPRWKVSPTEVDGK